MQAALGHRQICPNSKVDQCSAKEHTEAADLCHIRTWAEFRLAKQAHDGLQRRKHRIKNRIKKFEKQKKEVLEKKDLPS